MRQYKNSLTREPYQRLGELCGQALFGDLDIQESIAILQDVDFQKFLAFKKTFFRNIKFVWLISGHLDEARALKILEIAKSSIDHKVMDEDDMVIFD